MSTPSHDCRECGENRCQDCARPGGTRQAADGTQHPVCCCGRRFRLEAETEPTLGDAYWTGWNDALHAAAEAIRAAEAEQPTRLAPLTVTDLEHAATELGILPSRLWAALFGGEQ